MSEPASAELYDAVRWYETRRPGLGAGLFDAVSQTLEFVETSPEAGAAISTDAGTR